MTIWEAIVLGFIQGVTEFLPVSSSGHLELGQYFLGFRDLHRYILFNLICHLGTLCAIFYVFCSQLKQSFTTHKILFFRVILGTLPLFPLVFILKPIEAAFDQPQYLGICFLFSAFLLFAGTYCRFRRTPHPSTYQWLDPFIIGIFQAIAILPGISRSGATISAANLLGWKKEDAVIFSFLLAIPAILGSTTLEILKLFFMPATEIASLSFVQFIAGFLTSFFIGCLALALLLRLLKGNNWVYFAWYCLFLGIFLTFSTGLANLW